MTPSVKLYVYEQTTQLMSLNTTVRKYILFHIQAATGSINTIATKR